MERLSLIDISTADDFLVPSPPGEESMPESFSGLFEDLVEDNFFQKQMELGSQLPESPLSPEHNQNHSGRYSMRESLAWDNAFFTSEGVLNHEELAEVNSSFKKSESRSLSIIMEDVARSAESISSADDGSLENLEVDLFHNARPSIQKTLGTTEKANKLAHPSKKSIIAKEGALPLGSSMRTESASRNKNKSSMALGRSGACSNHREATSRATTVANVSAVGISRSKTLPYPQRALPRATPSTMLNKKSCDLGNTQIRTTNAKDKPGNAVTQKSVGAPKKKTGGPCNGTVKSPSPAPNSGSNSLDVASKSRLRITSASRAINQSSSEPITNRTSMKTSRSRTVTRNPAVSPNSSVNLYSITSPSSSFDSITSGSSSSTVFGVKTSTDALDACSPSSTFSEGSDHDKIHSPEDNIAYQPSRGNYPRSFNSNNSRPKCSKPSGLRMPAPKLGYFDANRAPTCNIRTLPKAQHFASGCPQAQDPPSCSPSVESSSVPELSKLVEPNESTSNLSELSFQR